MKKQPIRVGFDLDGVILYNPARIVRPLIAFYKKFFLKKKVLKFYYPHSPFEKTIWKLVHKSSIFIAPGLNDIKQLVKRKKIKAYIVTARYGFMGKELVAWFKKNELDLIFSELYYNKHDDQPHIFKERMIKKLKLDFFVEDNYDIVQHIGKSTKAKAVWIYNLFDRGIHYPYKMPYLQKAVTYIREHNDKKK